MFDTAAKILSWCVTGRWSRTRSMQAASHAALPFACSRSTNVIMVWAWMLWSSHALGARTLLWFGHGCSGHRMLFERERYDGLGMDALVIV